MSWLRELSLGHLSAPEGWDTGVRRVYVSRTQYLDRSPLEYDYNRFDVRQRHEGTHFSTKLFLVLGVLSVLSPLRGPLLPDKWKGRRLSGIFVHTKE